MKKSNGLGKFAVGALIGAGVALLFAPKTGKELRKDLKIKLDEVLEDVKELEMDDVKEAISKKVKEIEEDIKEFDKEKVVSVAKAQAKKIEKKTTELVKEAEKAAKPALVELTNDIKNKTIKTLKVAIEHLEKDAK